MLGARRIDRLRALVDEIGIGHDAVVETDVAEYDLVVRLIDRAVALYGRVDVLLNNAGIMAVSSLELGKIEDWDRMINVNVKGSDRPTRNFKVRSLRCEFES